MLELRARDFALDQHWSLQPPLGVSPGSNPSSPSVLYQSSQNEMQRIKRFDLGQRLVGRLVRLGHVLIVLFSL
nr:hypothetical protein CFP56_00481 [Quercus suber]